MRKLFNISDEKKGQGQGTKKQCSKAKDSIFYEQVSTSTYCFVDATGYPIYTTLHVQNKEMIFDVYCNIEDYISVDKTCAIIVLEA